MPGTDISEILTATNHALFGTVHTMVRTKDTDRIDFYASALSDIQHDMFWELCLDAGDKCDRSALQGETPRGSTLLVDLYASDAASIEPLRKHVLGVE